MSRLFDYDDEGMFTKDVLTQTQKLCDEAAKISTPDTTQLDDEIRACDAAVKDAILVRASPTIMGAVNLALYKCQQQKTSLRFSLSAKRQEIFAQINKLNTPIIYSLCRAADEALRRLQERVVFRRLTTETSPVTDEKIIKCRTNLPEIEKVRTVIMDLKRIRNMYHRPASELQQAVKDCEEKLADINLEKIMTLECSVLDVQELEESLGRRPSIQHVQPQQQGILFDQHLSGAYEKLKAVVQSATGGFIKKGGA